MRGLRAWGRAALRGMPPPPASDRASALRTLRDAHCLAGPPLPGMRRPSPRVCERPRRRLLRRCRSRSRRRVEGARAAAACRRGRLGRDRGPRAAAGGGAHIRSARPGSWSQARSSPAPATCGGTGPALAAAAGFAASPPRRQAAAGPLAGRAASQCRRSLRRQGPAPEFRRTRRRCLHERRDRKRRGLGAAKSRRPPGRGGDFRASSPLDFDSCSFA